jgi:hypothetical protein
LPYLAGWELRQHRFGIFFRTSDDCGVVRAQYALVEIAASSDDARVALCGKQFHVFAFLDAKNSNSDHTRAFRTAGTARRADARVYTRLAGRFAAREAQSSMRRSRQIGATATLLDGTKGYATEGGFARAWRTLVKERIAYLSQVTLEFPPGRRFPALANE